MNSNIVILDGQNGYGKTTLFDAIEVLVTGKIKHFNPSLQNRKTETLGTLANDVNKDIVISAILSSDFSDEIHVERKLLCKNEFQSIITLNSQEISQEELYDKFHLNSNMFDIGTYISQSESLDFLQNKYKNRKDSVSSLLDDTEITDKIQMLKSVQEHIFGRVEKEIRDKEKQIDVVSQRVNEIKRQTDHIVMNAELPGENIRLFDEVEYEFDVIKLDQGVTYETIIQQLKQIEGFIENYEEYLRYKVNAIIRELKASPKRLYMALFYRQEIELLNKKGSLIKELNKSKELLTNYSNNVWSVDETLFNKIKIKAEIIAQIKTLLLNQKKEQSQLDDADKVLAQMTKARRGLTDIASSSTAWLLLQGLISEYGEDGAKDVLKDIYVNAGDHIEESGSGPLKLVRAGEVAIGFGLRQQAVADKAEGLPIDYVDPAEGNFTLTESVAVVDKGDNSNEKAMEMAECIINNGRKDLLANYPIPLYEGETVDEAEKSGNPKTFPEKLTVDLLKKHQTLSEECKPE